MTRGTITPSGKANPVQKDPNKSKIKNNWNQTIAKIASIQHAPKYAFFGVSVLILTTLLWSVLGSLVNQGNSDQLINTSLFDNSNTFRNAELPGAHSFLIKWPLFYIIHLFGSNKGALLVATVLSALTTVSILALIIHKIEKRPIVFGTICLALASALLLVPTQPFAGALLPVNMAMLATRNLEYILFILSIFFITRTPTLKSRSFWLGIALLSVLVASDKLFLTLSVGGAGCALVFYSLAKGWNLVSLSVNWLVGSLLAGLGAIGILGLINSSGLVKISAQSGISPYAFIKTFHDLALGLIYGISGILTNFGANPAFDEVYLKRLPSTAIHRLLSVSGPAFVINFIILLVGVYAILQLLGKTIQHNKDSSVGLEPPTKLSVALVWAALASFVSFVISNHYYAVDARYLTIFMFALFISIATVASQKNTDSKKLVSAGFIIFAGLCVGSTNVISNYHSQMKAMNVYKNRNELVVQAIKKHPVKVLVGDYWRMLPTKSLLNGSAAVLPLENCTQPRAILSSKAWNQDLTKTSFAYLLTLEKGQAGSPACELSTIIKAYGRPNTSALIAGLQDNPSEILLFYDKGANNSSPNIVLNTPSTVLPIPITELPYTSCPTGRSVMNITAHQDDDLLFMNPDTLHSLQAGDCIRSVYLTAGDAGGDQLFWLGREQGSEAAYSTMESTDNIWVKRIVKLGDKEYINVSHPRGDYQVSLIFLRLPDGNLKGQGFRQTLYESLSKLDTNSISSIASVDGQSSYSKTQVIDALVTIMRAYGVDEIRTQSNYVSKQYPDHSDHMAVGRLVQAAYKKYTLGEFENTVAVPIHYYTGYPVREQPANVSGSDLIATEAAFLSYAHFDGTVCQSHADCSKVLTYGSYLSRQYQKPY